MDGKAEKACVFGTLIVITYAIHQLTVGGDGILVASVLATLAGIGGYVVGALGKQGPAATPA